MSKVQWLGQVEWLGEVTCPPGYILTNGLCLPDPKQLVDPKYKGYLIAWSKKYKAFNFAPPYGDWAGDESGIWDCFRDGQVLSAFSNWWNMNKKGPELSVGSTPSSGVCKNTLVATLDLEHQDALHAFVVEAFAEAEKKLVTKYWAPGNEAPPPPAGGTPANEAAPPGGTPTNETALSPGGSPGNETALSPGGSPGAPASTEKKTPWGAIIIGGLVVGAAAWAMGAFGGGLAGVAENPYEVHYEVHWARSNRADEMVALRRGAKKHMSLAEAEQEARQIRPPRPNLVPLVVEVRGTGRSLP